MFTRVLLAILVFCGAVSSETVEYGGISFECDAGCAIPEYDCQAREIVRLLGAVAREVNENCEIPNQQGMLRQFSPYLFWEDYKNTISFTRYDWEKGNGKYFEDLNAGWAQSDYETFCNFDLTHSDLSRLATLLRRDISFYLTAREEYFKYRSKKAAKSS